MATRAAAAAIGLFLATRGSRKRKDAPSDAGEASPTDEGRGRLAAAPEEIPAKGLRDVAWRVYSKISEDRVLLIAAGVTFYLLLALFPSLAALVSLYGLLADPATMTDHLRQLAGLLPPGAFDMLADQIRSLVEKRDESLGLTFFIGLVIALWSTHSGTLAIFDAMNIAYGEREKRGIIRLNLVGMFFAACAILAAILIITLVAGLPIALSYLWLDHFKENLALFARWPILLAVVVGATIVAHRYGPSREPARFRWITWGAALTAAGWFAMSLAFSFYLNHFANYGLTYGAFGTLIGLLMWTWLSLVILIVGAMLNAELEHQTTLDTTTGPPQPMGARGAFVADTLGDPVD